MAQHLGRDVIAVAATVMVAGDMQQPSTPLCSPVGSCSGGSGLAAALRVCLHSGLLQLAGLKGEMLC